MALGQMQSNLDFINHGMAMYCQALSNANQALQHAATAQTDATLATCVILAMCEMYRPRAGSEVSTHALDFQRHVQGTARLLELRGSQRHVQEHGFTLFANARSIIAHSGITQGQRAFLDSDQWFEVPWSMQDRERTLKDRLVDVMLAVTASLEQLDRCRSQSSYEDQHTEEALTASVTSCLASLQLLQAWEAKVLKTSAHARLEDVCAKQGFGTFHLVMSYWAVSLILSARCWPVLACIGEHTPALEALASLLSSPQTCFVNIANHAHRYFPLSTGLVGPHQATFPLGTALNFINAWETADTVEREQLGVGSMYGQEDMRKAVAKMKTLFYTDERARGTAEFLNSIGLQKT